MSRREPVAAVQEIERNLYARRKALGLSLTESAAISGIDRERIARIERAEGVIRLTELFRLSAAIELPVETLLNGGSSSSG